MSERVRLLVWMPTRTIAPNIVMGELSSTGKTISVEYLNTQYRFDADEILSGGSEQRSSWCFELYAMDRYLSIYNQAQEAGHQSASSQVESLNLPYPTHTVEN
jgi:hypothetical protein